MSDVVFTNMDDFLARYGTDEEKKAAQARLSMTSASKEENPAATNGISEIHHRKGLPDAMASIQATQEQNLRGYGTYGPTVDLRERE